jgi:hypothetical protein
MITLSISSTKTVTYDAKASAGGSAPLGKLGTAIGALLQAVRKPRVAAPAYRTAQA